MTSLPLHFAASLAIVGAVSLLTASRAHPADSRSLSGTVIRLQPTQAPGAVAEVHFDNRAVNGPADVSTFPLVLGEVRVSVSFRWNANVMGDDEIVVETEPGFVARPRTLPVAEGMAGTVVIYPVEWVGF